MRHTSVQEERGIRVGDRIYVVPEGAREVLAGVVERIVVAEWDAVERARLGVPAREVVFALDNGLTAGDNDRIFLAEPRLLRVCNHCGSGHRAQGFHSYASLDRCADCGSGDWHLGG